MSTHKNLITLCVAALFTLGLAACGGNGNGNGDDPVTTDPGPGDGAMMPGDGDGDGDGDGTTDPELTELGHEPRQMAADGRGPPRRTAATACPGRRPMQPRLRYCKSCNYGRPAISTMTTGRHTTRPMRPMSMPRRKRKTQADGSHGGI